LKTENTDEDDVNSTNSDCDTGISIDVGDKVLNLTKDSTCDVVMEPLDIELLQKLFQEINNLETNNNTPEQVPSLSSSVVCPDVVDSETLGAVPNQELDPKTNSVLDPELTSVVQEDTLCAEQDSFSFLQCEVCGHNESYKWRQIMCDADGLFFECIPCEKLFIIPKIFTAHSGIRRRTTSDAFTGINKRSKKHQAGENKTSQSGETLHGECKSLGRTRVSKLDMLKPGDHIEWHRNYVIYHHAIVKTVNVNENSFRVIHYTSDAKKDNHGNLLSVRETEFTFKVTGGDMMFRIDYEPDCCLPVEETLKRARKRIGEANYRPFRNNCEHFATECKTGQGYSGQVKTFINRIAWILTGAGFEAGSEIVEAGVLHIATEIPMDSVLDVVRDITMVKAQSYGAAAANLAEKLAVGTIALSVGISLGAESLFLSYFLYQAYCQFKNEHITREDFERQRLKLGCESLGGFVCGSLGGLLGQIIIPCPLLGAIVGCTLGSLVGRYLGALIGKMIADKFLREEKILSPTSKTQ